MDEPAELSVSEARNNFSNAVNRAAFGREVTYITRGRNRSRTAAIVPIDWLDHYEELLDLEDARVARERLEDIRSGASTPLPAEEVYRELGL